MQYHPLYTVVIITNLLYDAHRRLLMNPHCPYFRMLFLTLLTVILVFSPVVPHSFDKFDRAPRPKHAQVSAHPTPQPCRQPRRALTRRTCVIRRSVRGRLWHEHVKELVNWISNVKSALLRNPSHCAWIGSYTTASKGANCSTLQRVRKKHTSLRSRERIKRRLS